MTRAQVQPIIAGRPMPGWTLTGLKALFVLLAVAFAMRFIQLAAEPAPAPPPPEVAAAPALASLPTRAPPPAPPPPVRLELDRPLQHGDFAWNDEGVPEGPVWVHVDLGAQMLYVFRAGHEIGRAVILYGTQENPTPTGTFTVTEKKVEHESNLYEAAMPWMMRLTNDGIAIHGSHVRYGWASRGCIGVPHEFARLLFGQAAIGTRVTIAEGGPLPPPPRA